MFFKNIDSTAVVPLKDVESRISVRLLFPLFNYYKFDLSMMREKNTLI